MFLTSDFLCARRFSNVNINVAVQTDNGLYVPIVRVSHLRSLCLSRKGAAPSHLIMIWQFCHFAPKLKDADKKGLSRISEEVKHLAQKAKENSLKPEDYEVKVETGTSKMILKDLFADHINLNCIWFAGWYVHSVKLRWSFWHQAILCHYKSTPSWHSRSWLR